MQKNVAALVVMLGGLCIATVCVFLAVNLNFLNYRELRIPQWFFAWANVAFGFYLLGLYGAALWQRASKIMIEPTFVVLGGAVGLLTGLGLLYLQQVQTSNWLYLPTLALLPLFSYVGIRLAYQYRPLRSPKITAFMRIATPLLIGLMLWVMRNGSFPGTTAPAAVRQQWAYNTFNQYHQIVSSIKACQPIIMQVGPVKLVAPTQGKNYVVADPGSSGHQGEMTLEVVGEKGTGTINFNFHIDTALTPGQFTYGDKTQNLNCNH